MNRHLLFIFVAFSLTHFISCRCDCECSERYGCRTVTVRKNDGSRVIRRFCSDDFGPTSINLASSQMADSIDAFISLHGPFANAIIDEDSISLEKGMQGIIDCKDIALFERKGYTCRCAR